MSCRNCANEIAGKYCSQCGQKSTAGRLSFFGLIHDFAEGFFHAEAGFIKTVKDLTLHPGQMIHDYIDGKRAHYVPATKYLLFILFLAAITLSSLAHRFDWTGKVDAYLQKSQKTHTAKIAVGKGPNDLQFLNWATLKYQEKDGTFKLKTKTHEKLIPADRVYDFLRVTLPFLEAAFAHNIKLTLLAWIPLMSLLSLIVFRKWKWNLAEHLTAQSYLFAQTLLIFCISSIFFWFFPAQANWILLIFSGVAVTYYLVSYIRLAPNHAIRTGVATFAVLGMSALIFFSLAVSVICVSAAHAFEQAMLLPFP